MDIKRKKELLEEWRNRHPEMGVISFKCKETNESFLEISKDIKATFNSNIFQLSVGMHPNKRLAELWNKYGKEGFELLVLKILKYENPTDDYTEKSGTGSEVPLPPRLPLRIPGTFPARPYRKLR